jgi:hypothetical protein
MRESRNRGSPVRRLPSATGRARAVRGRAYADQRRTADSHTAVDRLAPERLDRRCGPFDSGDLVVRVIGPAHQLGPVGGEHLAAGTDRGALATGTASDRLEPFGGVASVYLQLQRI